MTMTRPGACGYSVFGLRTAHAAMAMLALAAGSTVTLAPAKADPPVILQWFESRWTDMERRMPDFFLAGYGGVWLPSPVKAFASSSAGYDTFDRFDLGRPGAQTTYGTEQYFRALVDEFHQANGLVYIDAILNHSSGRQTSISFQQAGGYPGFWMASANTITTKQPTDNWGDFHNGIASGYYQSENPGGARYDLQRGDLVALIDIAQESNFSFIRQPVAANAQNIPAGTTYNKPDANNYRYYPDRQLTPKAVSNPGTARNPGTNNFTFYPYNTVDPLQGDPVADNGTGMLMRWTQWMLDEHKVDGFRFDAIKHAPSWFWDTFIDAEMFERRRTPDGRFVTPFSFGECVESNQYTYDNFVRKPNNNNRAGDTWGNRDCLDLNGAGQLRNIVNDGGTNTWQNAINNHLDNSDNFNDGTLGVNHVFSHDNGTTGDGNSAPVDATLRQMGLPQNAYTVMKPGQSLIYHNARGINRSGGFWPKGGIPIALGVDPATNVPNPVVSRVVQLHNWVGRGQFYPINNTDTVNSSPADVLIFERRRDQGGGLFSGNVLVGVNDSYSNGFQTRNVLTTFPAGTRLVELTGNAADPVVDPSNVVADVLIVGVDLRVTITVPNNRNPSGVETNKGFVVYAPAIPSGVVTFTNVTSTLPADAAGTSSARRRIASIPVITTNSFEIQLTTTKGDPGAANNNDADDSAAFRINQGYQDWNGNPTDNVPYTDDAIPGYDRFSFAQPLASTSNVNGIYRQTINATLLPEGYNYISTAAFRKRPANNDPLFREIRSVVYIDRQGPSTSLVDANAVITATSYKFTAKALDRTSTRMYVIYDLPSGTDAIAYANSNPATLATRNDRYEWFRTITGLQHGFRAITVVAFEESGNASATASSVFIDLCGADFDKDGFVSGEDFDAYVAAFELGSVAADYDGDGFVTGEDFDAFVIDFEAGC